MILLAFLSGISTGASDAELGFDRFSICVQASEQDLTGRRVCPLSSRLAKSGRSFRLVRKAA